MPYELKLILLLLIQLYSMLLILRIIVEMIAGFSRQMQPPRWFALLLEPVFVLTDPPVKLFRRLIPPLTLGGGVALDLSVIAVFLCLRLLAFIVKML